MSLPIKFRTGNTFLAKDKLVIGEPVWDKADVRYHRFGVGSGELNPRWYPGVDNRGNLRMNYGTMLKFPYAGYNDSEIGFDGSGNFVVRIDNQVIIRAGKIGVEFYGVLKNLNTPTTFTPSNTGLAELMFPLFTDKNLIANFARPAFAAVDRFNKFRAYRDQINFMFDFNSTFTRTQVGKPLFIHSNSSYAPAEVNEPRISYNPISSKCRGLMIEPGSSNLITYSYALDQWTSTGLTLTKVDPPPSGWINKGLNAPFSFAEATTNTIEHSFSKSFSADVTKPISASFFFSARTFTGTRKFTALVSNSDRSSAFGYDFTCTSGSAPVPGLIRVINKGGINAITAVVDNIGLGIYRIKLTGTIDPTVTGATSTVVFTLASLGDSAANTALVFTANAGIGNWGYFNDFQLEQRNFATSYMPTAAVVASRGSDILTLDLTKFQFSTTDGLLQFKSKHNSITVGTVIFSLQNSDGTTRVDYYLDTIVATTWNISAKTYVAGALTNTAINVSAVNSSVIDMFLNYTNLPDSIVKLVVSGDTGFLGVLNLISYE